MAFRRVYSSAVVGINALTVEVEANVSPGIGMYLVGLPDSAVKESHERIRSAFENSGLRMVGKKTIVNLAPADLKKEGSSLDLPIAIAMLAATEQVANENIGEWVIMGELSLDGTVKPIKGALPVAIEALAKGFRGVILPKENADEAAVVEGLEVIGVGSLKEAVDFLNGVLPIFPTKVATELLFVERANRYGEDFSDVKGQEYVKRALEVAAAGGHNIVMIGAPGSGKTMLARRMPTIMPPLSLEEALETTKIHSVAGKLGSEKGLLTRRPFRAPHHLASAVAMVGGGSNPQPGEISLAHNGILFLDELPEFGRSILEVMRQPLEDKVVTVARAKYSVVYPANFMLVASMNPCPCGYYNHPTKECNCSRYAVEKYINKISGPLMDRIDIQIEVTPVEYDQMQERQPAEPSSAIRQRVIAARERQQRRFEGIEGVFTNAMMNSAMIAEFCPLDEQCSALLGRAMERLSLSARAYNRIIKVARTIADLEGAEQINSSHIAEAIGYRNLDRENWGVRVEN
ncbi:MAG: YifB family Mg chelatase-like AAA ATPase [Tidjanibacter sp.]|nr:YifB family Mg chelatase-like AAA ATPase [Tidjanibacter sp.]